VQKSNTALTVLSYPILLFYLQFSEFCGTLEPIHFPAKWQTTKPAKFTFNENDG